ncbi:MAG: excisionase family DNA-binding protein [Caryophanon sp.]|nr:excisionase family DNA-binding protein [Caryophanon sp.]
MYYKNVEETAKDLGMPQSQVLKYIYEGRIKAVFDGEEFLINSGQFDTYYEQLERIKEEIEVWRNTPIPDDMDVKDED